MHHKIISTISIILATILPNHIHIINNIQNTDNDIFLSTFATHYFSHLTTNRSYNIHGSCGYVAISLFLSFYDTFWNDSIIPEQYDENSYDLDVSPGIKSDIYFQNCLENDIYQYIVNNTYSQEYFQFLLFKIGYEGGYITFSNNNISLGVGNSIMDYILSTYPYDSSYLGASTYEYYLHDIDSNSSANISSTDVKNFAINYISQGFPVIIGYPGHVTVAYDYDINTDTLFGHFGWEQNSFHEPYTDFSDSWAIILSNNHQHTSNYIINSSPICPCQLPSHIHNYDYNISSYNMIKHKKSCYCEDFFFDNHTLYPIFIRGIPCQNARIVLT